MAGSGIENEAVTLLRKLKESCTVYTSSKHPFTSKGKIRKAIITQIEMKVTQSLDEKLQSIKTTSQTSLSDMKEEKTEEKVNKAFRSNMDMLYHVLNGNIELSEEERKNLDSNMESLLKEIATQKVGEQQNKNLSTCFFNALGWSKNDATFVDMKELDDEKSDTMKKSPYKRKMYHSMNPYNDKSGLDLAKQLMGLDEKNKGLFYGCGRFGRGIYTSARAENNLKDDDRPYYNSWRYGDEKDAAMCVMTLNQNARIVTQGEVRKREKELKKQFPKIQKYLELNHGHGVYGGEHYTMIAALYGYNTILGISGIPGADYITTSDRKAFTMAKQVLVRTVYGKDSDPEEKSVKVV